MPPVDHSCISFESLLSFHSFRTFEKCPLRLCLGRIVKFLLETKIISLLFLKKMNPSFKHKGIGSPLFSSAILNKQIENNSLF